MNKSTLNFIQVLLRQNPPFTFMVMLGISVFPAGLAMSIGYEDKRSKSLFRLKILQQVINQQTHFQRQLFSGGAVCHGPAGLLEVTLPNGEALVKGRQVTAFSDSEEVEAGFDKIVPFSLEKRLKELGGHYAQGTNWTDHVIVDGNLVTGQNPQSSRSVATKMLEY